MSVRQRKELQMCTCLSNEPAELLFSVADRVNNNKCMYPRKTTFSWSSVLAYCVVQSTVICCAHNGLCCASRALCLFPCQTVRTARTAGPFKAAA